MHRRDGLLGRGLLLAGGLLVGASAAEWTTRLFEAGMLGLRDPHVRFDPELGWLQRAGPTGTRINEAGETIEVRGEPRGLRAPPTAYRRSGVRNVLVVGDSMTAGQQVRFEDTFPARTQRQLSRRHPDLQVINAGVDGFDLAQSYRLMVRLWPELRPVHVVLALYVGNDLADYSSESSARPPWQRAGPLEWLGERSYLYHFVRGALSSRTRRPRWPPLPARVEAWDPARLARFVGAGPSEIARLRRQFAATELVAAIAGDESPARLAETCRMIVAFDAFSRTEDAGFTLLILPSKLQVVSELREVWTDLHRLGDELVERPQRSLAECAHEASIAVLDATPVLLAAAAPDALFWTVDLHFTPAGHAEVATALSVTLDGALASESFPQSPRGASSIGGSGESSALARGALPPVTKCKVVVCP